MILRLIALFLFFQLSLAEPKQLECKRKSAKICQLDVVIWERAQTPKLPDLSSKHTLVIRSGSIADFSKTLADQLGNVNKLHLGQLGITSLYISSRWTSLKAEFNQIGTLHVEELVDEFDDQLIDDKNIAEAEKFLEESQNKDQEDTTVPILPDSPKMSPPKVNELIVLNLANNRLHSVDNLKYLSKLKELLLDNNRIEFIKMETFASMKNLQQLSLSKNKINRVTMPTNYKTTNFLSLERLSLAFNQLTRLDVKDWTMLQLTHLDVSHNQLTAMDVQTFKQFVSLEKLYMGNNLWHCEWLRKSVENIDRAYVQLEDSQETCPKEQYKVKGICCMYTLHGEAEPVNNLERISRIEEANKRLNRDLDDEVGLFQTKWTNKWESLHEQAKRKMKPYEELQEKMLKDDNKAAEKAIGELRKLFEDCQKLLEELNEENKRHKEFTQKFTNLFYTTLAEKNKLVQEMSKAAQLEDQMKKYESSFKDNN